MAASLDKYRWRTRLRGVLPSPLWRLVPKGHGDCGEHEWYRATEELDACYHCRVGERMHVEPLAGEERGTDALLARELSRNGRLAMRLGGRRSQPVR
jgi:hypothetical protein